MKKFKARVRPAGSNTSTEVRIEAESAYRAKQLLETQYGKGSVTSAPQETR
jgi:hypothetical protein